MVLDYILITLGIVLIILGLLGCILPIIPGPPLSWAGLLLTYFSTYGNFSGKILLWTGLLALLATIADYILPIWTTKKMGGSKQGIWGATIGLILGIFILPPIGIIIGPFIGAFLGECTNGKSNPWLSATGSLIGLLIGTGLKFAVSGIITYHFVVETFLR